MSAHDSLARACLDYLRLHRIPATRINQRPVKTDRGWRTPGADPGTPDIIACLDGRCILIECKTGNADLTFDQRAFRWAWERAGALWITARSVTDLAQLRTGAASSLTAMLLLSVVRW